MWGVQKWWDLSKHVSNTLTSLILFTFAALRVISLCLDDDNGGEFCLGGMSKKIKMIRFNFLACNCIFQKSEHHKFENFSQPWWDIQIWQKIQQMFGEMKHCEVHRNMRQYSLKVNTRKSGNQQYVSLPFCWSWQKG